MQKLTIHFLFFTFLSLSFFTTLTAEEAFISGTASYENEELLPEKSKV